MLTRFEIDNFKSLVEFSLPGVGTAPLGQFVCLVGLNGSGKSTVLQALDFVSQLAVGDVNKWLAMRGWEKKELVNKSTKKRSIVFTLVFKDRLGELVWNGSYNYLQDRCTKEELVFTPNINSSSKVLPKEPVSFQSDSGSIRGSGGFRRDIESEYSGSIFNRLKTKSIGSIEHAGNVVLLLRYFLLGVKSLELLSPHSMRKRSKKAVDLGLGGESLAAFVYGLSGGEKDTLFNEIVKFYPKLQGVSSKTGPFGWKRFLVSEKYDSTMELDARHINDGLLRIAAIVAQTVALSAGQKKVAKSAGGDGDEGNPDQKGYQFVLLDEIENGINPELIERLVKYLLTVRQQIFVTTHSPLILNFLPDDVAKDSIFVLYRCASGSTKVCRFFDIPEAASRLDAMGPGEVFLDVRLEDLSSRLSCQ